MRPTKTYFPIKNHLQQGIIGVLAGIFLVGIVISFTKPAWSDTPLGIATMLQTRKINTLEDYLAWISDHMKYQANKEDTWANPENTLLSGHGNCADLAFLHETVLTYFGYRSKVLSIGRGNIAHVFTLFNKEGKLYMFDNLRLRNFGTLAADEVVKNLITQFNASFLLQLNFESKSVKMLYSQYPFPLKFKIKSLQVIYPSLFNKSLINLR